MRRVFALLSLLACVGTASAAVPADWTAPVEPFRISGNLYYVGTRDLAAFLVATPQGNVLLNANLASSPPQLRASVEKLGFRWADIRILLSSQAHPDHAAGAAQILAETHAQHLVMAGDAEVMRSGGALDFDSTLTRFAPTRVDRVLQDLETVTLGGTVLTAHKTAGHTRGCTTWTLQTHENGRTLQVAIVGGWSLNPGVALVSHRGKPPAYPDITNDFEHTFAVLKALPCDIFLGAHGLYFDLLPKLARMAKEGPNVWLDPEGYRRAVLEREAAFRQELARQRSEP